MDRSNALLLVVSHGLVASRSRLVVPERFQVQRRKVFVLKTHVGATVLAFDFAEYANNRVLDRSLPSVRGARPSRRPPCQPSPLPQSTD